MINRFWFVALVSAVLGGVLGFIQAPYHFYLAILTWIGAYYLAQRSNRDYTVGYFFGLGYFFHVMSWIAEPFAVGPPQYANLGWIAWGLMAVGLAIFWWPIFRFRHIGWWGVPLAYLIAEGIRAVILTGLPWGLMAHGFIDTPFAQSAAYIGTFLLSAALVFVVLAVAFGRGVLPRLLAAMVVVGLALPAQFRPAPDVIEWADYRVTVVQANSDLAFEYNPDKWRAQLDTHIALSDDQADLAIWPEGASRFSPSADPTLAEYITSGIGAEAVLLGAPSYDDDQYFNSAYYFTRDGQSSRYDKRHLVPFGEYIPFGDFLLENGLFVQTVTTYAGRKGVARPWGVTGDVPRPIILICYEGIFPWLSRQEGEYLVQITNDSWFGTRSGPFQHLDIARYRAIENGMPLVRSAITGISGFVDANGNLREFVPLNTQGRITATLGPRYETTFYRRWGEWIAILVAASGAVLAFVMRIKKPAL